MNLQSLSSFCANLNLGGLLMIEYVPTQWVNKAHYEQVISDNYNFQKGIALNYGQWLKAPILPKGRIWNEKHKADKQGGHYRQEVNGVVPNLRSEVSGTLGLMANLFFLVRLEDGNGRKWIVGTLDSPLRFTTKGTTGGEGDLNHHSIQFYSQTSLKAWGYLPVI